MVANGRGIALPALSELKHRWLLIVTVTVAAAGAAAAYSFTAPKHYRSTASLVVSPVELSDPTFLGIDVLHDTSRRSAAETASHLLASPQVAEAVRVRLGLSGTAQSLLDDVSVHVLGDSNAVGVTATATDPKRAAQVANGFVDAFITARSAGFESEVASAIKRLRGRLAELTPAQRLTIQGMRLDERLGDLRARVGTGDPTLRHGTEAVEPESASSPHPVRWTILAAVLGLVIGCVAALAIAVTTAVRRREAADAVVGTTMTPAAAERRVERTAERVAERLDHLDEKIDRLTERLATASESIPEQMTSAAAATDTSAREHELDHRAEVLASREHELSERAAELAQREHELSDAERTLVEREHALDQPAAPAPPAPEAPPALPAAPPAPEAPPSTPEARAAPPPPAPEAPTVAPTPVAHARQNGAWRLTELEQLVEANAAAYPHRIDEWRSYLYYLRDYVEPGGELPGHFDWLIEDTFGDLLVLR